MHVALKRFSTPEVAKMFMRNTVVGTAVFAIDLAILWGLVSAFDFPLIIAVTTGFLVASSLHYYMARSWIFVGTDRHPVSGYLYFIVNAGVGLAITLVMFAAFLRWTSINYIVGRVIVSLFAGLATFLLNAIWNFRKI